MGRLTDGVTRLVSAARTVHAEELRYPAAALAYYGFVSFVPLLLLVFVLLGERLAGELGQAVPQFLTPSVQELVQRSLTTASGRTGAGALAALVLLWSGVNVVDDVRTVVERIEGSVGSSLRHWVRDATVILGALVLAILAVVATTTLLDLPAAGPLFGLVGFAVLWVVLAVAFVPLYYVPSSVVTSPTGAIPGAVVASFGWAALQTGIQFYATHAGRYAVYGTLSGVIILLTSLYIAAALLLTGIVVNAGVAAGPDHRRE
ncbi:YihY/virulence factor BrkB family protein [Salinirubellus sp. GCM10025818]|uniref:YihY/virulence factor BrkB family protein n=1 Tax=Salinirubellus TaxID=2162630 RepID=UPI0030CD3B7D